MSEFNELKQFIEKDMKMSHVYQPVMLIALLENEGHAKAEQIAEAILKQDPTQIEYYSEIVKNMVGRVLTKNRGITVKKDNEYSLKGYEDLTSTEKSELISLLQEKLIEFNKKRNDSQWNHRKRNRRPVPGSVRYEVLRRARDRCELCGISKDEKALEVDHIVPKSLGGKDDLANYQALCYTCNAQKNNKDQTDFRNLSKLYAQRSNDCIFCQFQLGEDRKIYDENTLGYAISDSFPVTKNHLLFIPKRHIEQYFEFTQGEINSLNSLIAKARTNLLAEDKSITGFNIGINNGISAGQTIQHGHIHLIPRREGDVENPRGGIRNVIPGKGNY